MAQAPAAVVMVRPHHFTPNPQTLQDNSFQRSANNGPLGDPAEVARRAYREVTELATALEAAGVRVHLFEDEGSRTPDSVFPNNWFSTHDTGDVVLYPMAADNRRLERRPDVIQALRRAYEVRSIVDYSVLEDGEEFLEGTGAMVFDHPGRTVYVCRSHRANEYAIRTFCTDFRYESVVFDAVDRAGEPIYHTNVMMSIGSTMALVCFEAIPDEREQQAVRSRLVASGREVIDITMAQLEEFLGNAIELTAGEGRCVVMSARAEAAVRPDQRERIERHVSILSVPLPTIELAGGSARCMIAGVHLLPRHARPKVMS